MIERNPYWAVGSGTETAIGSMHTTEGYDIPTRERLRLALQAAADLTPYVSGPFIYDQIN